MSRIIRLFWSATDCACAQSTVSPAAQVVKHTPSLIDSGSCELVLEAAAVAAEAAAWDASGSSVAPTGSTAAATGACLPKVQTRCCWTLPCRTSQMSMQEAWEGRCSEAPVYRNVVRIVGLTVSLPLPLLPRGVVLLMLPPYMFACFHFLCCAVKVAAGGSARGGPVAAVFHLQI